MPHVRCTFTTRLDSLALDVEAEQVDARYSRDKRALLAKGLRQTWRKDAVHRRARWSLNTLENDITR